MSDTEFKIKNNETVKTVLKISPEGVIFNEDGDVASDKDIVNAIRKFARAYSMDNGYSLNSKHAI